MVAGWAIDSGFGPGTGPDLPIGFRVHSRRCLRHAPLPRSGAFRGCEKPVMCRSRSRDGGILGINRLAAPSARTSHHRRKLGGDGTPVEPSP
jgi:hypothetical protein